MHNNPNSTSTHTFLIDHDTNSETYSIWQFSIENPHLFSKIQNNKKNVLSATTKISQIGNYLLTYDLASNSENGEIKYNLVKFNSKVSNIFTNLPLRTGSWKVNKFTGGYENFNWKKSIPLQLIPMTGYIMSFIPGSDRSTYRLWNFDPSLNSTNNSDSPIANYISTMDAFSLINPKSQLIPINNYVLEWLPENGHSIFRVWSFDPQADCPLSLPTMSEGRWTNIDTNHKMLAIGSMILEWNIKSKHYNLWNFDPSSTINPLHKKIKSGILPDDFEPENSFTIFEDFIPIDKQNTKKTGTIDYMRENIEHVVVYMLESRTMDNVLGWLHEHTPSDSINYIHCKPPFKGLNSKLHNKAEDKTFYVTKFNDGKLSDKITLNIPKFDPFHGTADAINQMYSDGFKDYLEGKDPDMGGFVANNCSPDVMATLTPEQLPVLNGLAQSYAVCDEWFSSLPGGTDSNRAFAATGSAFNITTTYEGNPQYSNFPLTTHRQSIWKVLWNHGIDDWKIYWSVKWYDHIFTYHLYLKGDIPSVDTNVDSGGTNFIAPIDQFIKDAQNNKLPKFSFLEPVWIAPSGATSYHPSGDLVPGEQRLKEIYEAISKGPGWKKTTLIITFSKGGGLYDHIAPPKATKPWPLDKVDGFNFDLLGPRVPTVVISPLVKEKTVFRSKSKVPYDATSIPATILKWFGIPQSRWGLGDRVDTAESFETVFQLTKPRTDLAKLNVPYDQTYPLQIDSNWKSNPESSEWNNLDNWDDKVPNDIAFFCSSIQKTIHFETEEMLSIGEINFKQDASEYTLLFNSKSVCPALTITGKGVQNNSEHIQKFVIASTSTGYWNPQFQFTNNASAGGANNFYYAYPESLDYGEGGGVIAFTGNSTAGSANFITRTGKIPPKKKKGEYQTVGGEISFTDTSNAGTAQFTIYGTLGIDGDTFGNVVFHKNASAANGKFKSIGGTVDQGDGGNTQFYNNSTAAYATFYNYGATKSGGNGGDVAMDGSATGGNGVFYNYASDVAGGHGGVTSFSNNGPVTYGPATTAGYGLYINFGATDKQKGGGGHLNFSSIYGSPTAGNATIHNYGSSVNGGKHNTAGYTIFSNTGLDDFFPTAAHAIIHNSAALTKNGMAGSTTFATKAKKYGNKPIIIDNKTYWPTAGESTIYNYGGAVKGATGGFCCFATNADAGNALIIAYGGENHGKGGKIIFSENSSGGNARIQLTGNAALDLSDLWGDLNISTLELDSGIIVVSIGSNSSPLTIKNRFFQESNILKFEFKKQKKGFKKNFSYKIFSAPNLAQIKNLKFKGSSIDGLKPKFHIENDDLLVSFH